MNFPFPHNSQKEVFKYTFLNEVTFKMSIPDGMDKIPFEKIKYFFKRFFNLDFKDMHNDLMLETRLKVGNESKGLMFEFSRYRIKISIDQSHYNNFHTSLLPIIEKFIAEFHAVTNKCGDIELKFEDVWPFFNLPKTESHREIAALEEAVFSPALRNMAEKINDNFKGVACENNEFKLYIRYGSYISKDSNENSGIALESRCELKNDEISLSNIADVTSRMNDILYDAFIWAVTPKIISAMKNLN